MSLLLFRQVIKRGLASVQNSRHHTSVYSILSHYRENPQSLPKNKLAEANLSPLTIQVRHKIHPYSTPQVEDRNVPKHYGADRQLYPTATELNRRANRIRKDEIIRYGKETIQRRSEFIEWNYSSEISAFAARIGEEFDVSKLSQAFLNPSYVQAEIRRQEELGMENATLSLETNEKLASKGQDFTVNILLQYTRAAFPYFPEEGVEAFVQYLTGLDVLANISFHLGTKDLIKSEEYPPLRETYMRTFYAIIGALAEKSQIRATRFIIDVIASQLHVQDINELWDIEDPMKTLRKVLVNDGREEPEARLMWASGKDTILACFHIGVFCNKEIIGQAQGETVEIAEEMAARDSLRRLFRTDDSRSPLPLGDEELAKLDFRSKPNLSINEWSESKAKEANIVNNNVLKKKIE